MTSFEELVATCTRTSSNLAGMVPYAYQRRIADEGFPDLLTVPTGAGKTLAVVLGWLYRRRFHPDPNVRASTPRWLVLCQPMRTLVEQAREQIDSWLELAGPGHGEHPVERFVFMGGEPTARNDWRLRAHLDAVVIGTQDMLLSRALNRGFGSSRYLWPVEFGLLNTNCQWVFDEIQLMGAGVPTGRQLQAFRDFFPSVGSQGSTWMSATVEAETLKTVDNATVRSTVQLTPADRSGPLSSRLLAPKTVRELDIPADTAKRAKTVAAAATERHRAGTLTLVVVNTVSDAQAIHLLVQKAKPAAELLLLHSRFRRSDRKALVRRLVSPIPPEGRLVISTQVIEAGMDLDAETLITEAAPWPSVVQRMGRCNRAGLIKDANVFWFAPAKLDKPRPYEAEDIANAIAALRLIEGTQVVPDGLAESGPQQVPKLHPVLRRKDLLGLFDTLPDITGSDVDVAPFVRDLDDDRTVHVAWRPLAKGTKYEKVPNQAELCPAPLSKDLSDWIDKNEVYRWDFTEAAWVRTRGRDTHPNQLLLTTPASGGYTPDRGWEPSSSVPVPDPIDDDLTVEVIRELDESIEDDSASVAQPKWVTLETHLLDTESAATELLQYLPVGPEVSKTLIRAAKLHDIGKAHRVFQDTMSRSAEKQEWPGYREHAPLAKAKGRMKHKTKNFRHELASALALLGEARPAIADLSPPLQQLCVYTIAAHHGRIRASLRSVSGEPANVVFGVTDGDVLPSVRIGGELVSSSVLRPSSHSQMGMSADGLSAPWSDLAESLMTEHGPFRLALFETVIRLADWSASSQPSKGAGE